MQSVFEGLQIKTWPWVTRYPLSIKDRPHLPVWNQCVSKMCIKILGINFGNRDGAGSKHKQWYSVGGRGLHKKRALQNQGGFACYLRLSSVSKRLITSLMQPTNYGEIPTSIHLNLELLSQHRYTRLQSIADTSNALKHCRYWPTTLTEATVRTRHCTSEQLPHYDPVSLVRSPHHPIWLPCHRWL